MSSQVFVGEVVGVHEMLAARERRSQHQAQLLKRYAPATLVSITWNIPGPIKTSPVLVSVAERVLQTLEAQLSQTPILYREATQAKTGMEAYWVIQLPPAELKRQLVAFEGRHPLGRLLDLDVVTLAEEIPTPYGRSQIGQAPRQCLLCDQEAKVCARNRTHSVTELQQQIEGMIQRFLEAEGC